jgi:hypothetical protein
MAVVRASPTVPTRTLLVSNLAKTTTAAHLTDFFVAAITNPVITISYHHIGH